MTVVSAAAVDTALLYNADVDLEHRITKDDIFETPPAALFQKTHLPYRHVIAVDCVLRIISFSIFSRDLTCILSGHNPHPQ